MFKQCLQCLSSVPLFISRYHVLCNKYNTQPLQDIEYDLGDKVENGNTVLLIDSSRRVIDAQQCAAIVEILRWDMYDF